MSKTKEERHKSSGKGGHKFMASYECRTRSNSLSCYEQLKSQAKPGQQPPSSMSSTVRAILFDWLFQVSEQFHFTHNTTYLAISIVDRYTSKQAVAKQKLQLIGVTALYIAHKLEETVPIKLKSFADVTDNGFSNEDIRQSEENVMVVLRWRVSAKTIGYLLDQAVFLWDDFAKDTSAAKVGFRNQANLHNYWELRRWCDYIILSSEVNQMEKHKVALALLYVFIKNHQAFKKQADQEVAALFGVNKKINKLVEEVFNMFLRERFQMRLSSLKKQINFLTYRLCLNSPLWKRNTKKGQQNQEYIFRQIRPFSKSIGYQLYYPQNLELFRLMGRELDF